MQAAMTLQAGQVVEVVGESYRQDVLRRVAADATDCSPFLDDLSGYARRRAEQDIDTKWFQAALVREPDNPVDSNAIAVHASGYGLVGYLSRDDAPAYLPIFRALERHHCAVGSCPGFLIGGVPGKPSYGVLLCLSAPDDVVSDLATTPIE
jgi:hypothetical protein